MRGFYDYFAYADGDAAKPRMSAAMGLYHLLRLCFTFKCSLFFKMTSGMGDAVFGPLFETCRNNGVTFRFFHQVLEVVPDPKSMSIASVRINRQVETRDEYRPLVTVNGLPAGRRALASGWTVVAGRCLAAILKIRGADGQGTGSRCRWPRRVVIPAFRPAYGMIPLARRRPPE